MTNRGELKRSQITVHRRLPRIFEKVVAKMGGSNFSFAIEHRYRGSNEVSQLADISRPGMRREQRHHLRANGNLPHIARFLFKYFLDQASNVGAIA